MRSKKQSPTWPYLGILVCLFILSINAPRAWQRIAHQESMSGYLSEQQAGQQDREIESGLEESENDGGAPAVDIRPSYDIELPPIVQATAGSPENDAPPATATDLPALDAPIVVPPVPALANEISGPAIALEQPADAPAEPQIVRLPLVSSPEPTAESSGTTWPKPTSLLKQLDELSGHASCAPWAAQVRQQVIELCQQHDASGRTAQDVIGELRALAKQADGLTSAIDERTWQARLVRVQYALVRRLEFWQYAANHSSTAKRKSGAEIKASAQRLERCVADLQSLTDHAPQGAVWREYLMLKQIESSSADVTAPEAERRKLARRILGRLSRERLTSSQHKFVSRGPVAALRTELQHWAAEPVRPQEVLEVLERYEQSGLPSDARLLADKTRSLRWSRMPDDQKAGENLDAHFRNANLRIVVSAGLLNRMVPQPAAVDSRVRDNIVGVPVRGRSRTFTRLFVRLVPDKRHLRMGLEASGTVASATKSTSGPATFYNSGESEYLVRKLFVVGSQGLRVWPAVAEADNLYSDLVYLETDYDSVPLIGPLVRNIARSQHEESQEEARSEVEYKVSTKARDQLDTNLAPRVANASRRYHERVAAPLERLALEPEPVSLSTTEDRLVVRLRLAAEEQLGAHTPRPQAPSDSLFSLQMHQSALNNAAQQLQLEGRTFTLPELFQWLAKKLGRNSAGLHDELPDDVRVRFADKDAVRLRCDDGRIEVRISLAELAQGRKRWRDFTVYTYYRPDIQGRQARFVRDGIIYLEGRTLKGQPQFVLRSIFSKVLSRNRNWSIIDPKLLENPGMQNLEITQFTTNEGWIALAYAPRRAPSSVARQPK